jgi:hypothetical protein
MPNSDANLFNIPLNTSKYIPEKKKKTEARTPPSIQRIIIPRELFPNQSIHKTGMCDNKT